MSDQSGTGPQRRQEPPQPPQEGSGGGSQEPHGAHRDARYREDLERYKAAVESLQTKNQRQQQQIIRLQRREVERLVADDLADPSDLWRDVPAVADLLGDDGNPDPERVKAKVKEIVERKPHYRRRQPTLPGHRDQAQKATPRERSWSDVIRGR